MNTSIQQQDSQLPVIAGHEITIDEHGRFNLNAIHKASGAGRQKRPSYWLATKQSKELISELEDQDKNSCLAPLKAYHGGAAPGTFAHELLAVSYAGWISPKFQLQVNQVFLDYRMGKLEQPSSRGEDATLTGTTIGTDGLRCLSAVLDGKLRHLPAPVRKRAKHHVWQQVHKAFSVVSAEDIPADQMDGARNFIGSYTMEGEWLEARTPKEEGATFTDEDLSDLYILLCHVYHFHAKWKGSQLEEAMRLLESPVASRMCEHLAMAQAFTNRLARTKGELMEVSRRRLGMNYGLLPIH